MLPPMLHDAFVENLFWNATRGTKKEGGRSSRDLRGTVSDRHRDARAAHGFQVQLHLFCGRGSGAKLEGGK